jgi:hypothetical protein
MVDAGAAGEDDLEVLRARKEIGARLPDHGIIDAGEVALAACRDAGG